MLRVFRFLRHDEPLTLAECADLDFGVSQDGSQIFCITRKKGNEYALEIPVEKLAHVIASLQWCQNAINQAQLRKEGSHESEM